MIRLTRRGLLVLSLAWALQKGSDTFDLEPVREDWVTSNDAQLLDDVQVT